MKKNCLSIVLGAMSTFLSLQASSASRSTEATYIREVIKRLPFSKSYFGMQEGISAEEVPSEATIVSKFITQISEFSTEWADDEKTLWQSSKPLLEHSLLAILSTTLSNISMIVDDRRASLSQEIRDKIRANTLLFADYFAAGLLGYQTTTPENRTSFKFKALSFVEAYKTFKAYGEKHHHPAPGECEKRFVLWVLATETPDDFMKTFIRPWLHYVNKFASSLAKEEADERFYLYALPRIVTMRGFMPHHPVS